MSKFSDLSAGQKVAEVLLSPVKILGGAFTFLVQSWAISRSGFAFLRGVPAVLAAGGFLLLVWFANYHLASREEARANGYFQFHSQNSTENPEYAAMFAEKLLAMRPDSEEYRYYLGIAKGNEDDKDSALELISSLAPEDFPGYANAHVWMSRHYLQNKDMSEDLREEKSVLHLKHALKNEPENANALLTITDFYQKRKDLPQASKYLKKLVTSEIKDVRQLLAFPRYVEIEKEMASEMDDRGKQAMEEKLKRDLNRMLIRVEPLSKRYPNEYRIWESMVRCAILLKDYDQARDIVTEGRRTATEEQVRNRINQLLTTILVENGREFDGLSDAESFKKRLNAFALAVQGNPRSAAPYRYIMEFVSAENTENANYDLMLRDAKLGSEAPGVIHLILGFREIAENNIAEGRRQWWIAEKEMIQAQTAVAQMIHVATFLEDGSVADTKDLLAVALDLFPDQMKLYFIRGNLLKIEKNYDEAIKDFEHILTKRENELAAHEQLAACYKEINNLTKANYHKEIAERLYAELLPNQRRIYDIIKATQM